MPNRFIFSLRFSTKVFAKLAFLAISMIVFMSLFRMNLYFLSVFHATPNATFQEVSQAFWIGFRFDLLIFGFLFIPLYLILVVQSFLQKWPQITFYFFKIYFSTIWFFICVITYIDFLNFVKFGVRMRSAEYSNINIDVIMNQFNSLPHNQVWVFSVISFLLLVLGLMLVKGLRFGDWKDEYSPQSGSAFETSWRLILPLLIVGFAARGTFEPHHLAFEHSEISSMKPINEMSLNAPWCFDK